MYRSIKRIYLKNGKPIQYQLHATKRYTGNNAMITNGTCKRPPDGSMPLRII